MNHEVIEKKAEFIAELYHNTPRIDEFNIIVEDGWKCEGKIWYNTVSHFEKKTGEESYKYINIKRQMDEIVGRTKTTQV